MAAASAARTDGRVAALPVWDIASAMPGCSAPLFVKGPGQHED
jgi:hypothetical protein